MDPGHHQHGPGDGTGSELHAHGRENRVIGQRGLECRRGDFIGPAGEVFREAGELAEQRRGEIVDALKQELARHETSEGIVLGSSSWTATARNPR